ncbi:hypothetical protein [Paenibacillus sp. 1P07SE]|uniref:hypothetical protein n=1 Tax=Paenibacillus sp. 1P07SE TaxID=3132209 RepID=UPI0039A69508
MSDLLTVCLILLTAAGMVLTATAVWAARVALGRLNEIHTSLGKLQTDTSQLIGELHILTRSADQSLQHVNRGLVMIEDRLRSGSHLGRQISGALDLAHAGWEAWQYWQERRAEKDARADASEGNAHEPQSEGSNP